MTTFLDCKVIKVPCVQRHLAGLSHVFLERRVDRVQ